MSNNSKPISYSLNNRDSIRKLMREIDVAKQDRQILAMDYKKKDKDYQAYITDLEDDLKELLNDEQERKVYFG